MGTLKDDLLALFLQFKILGAKGEFLLVQSRAVNLVLIRLFPILEFKCSAVRGALNKLEEFLSVKSYRIEGGIF